PSYVIRSTNAWDPNQTTTFQATQVDLGGEYRYPIGGTSTPNPLGLHSMVWVVADPTTGPTPHVYAMGAMIPPGPDPLDVFFARSTDGGVSFDPPVRLNTDPQQSGNWQWLPVMSIAPNGRIDVVWNDTRATGTPNLNELYYTCSSDGGLTWSPNQKVSGQWDAHLGWGNNAHYGEYNQMVSDNVGADLAWTATFNGEMDIFHTRLGDYDCNQNSVGDSTDIANQTSADLNQDGVPDECEFVPTSAEPDFGSPAVVHSAFPNPFRHSTTVRFTIETEEEVVRLRVFDLQGRELHRLVDGSLRRGRQEVVWDGREVAGELLPSGVYFYLLEIGGVRSAGKLVLSR
ncbi:MAG: T9SS type A sorting domain-containing protein, partial [Candidatus Eisenbacteria bacterium]|nr:T9SS type A sorting domain-containing protein [Candidatus Eisenbacteria bacterium]